MDHKKIEKAVQLFLEGIGEDCTREGLAETPKRIANMCEQLFGGYEQDAEKYLSRTFHADTGNMVVEKDITLYSECGKVHIGYIPDGKVVGLSKLARTVEVFARRAQIQEQLTEQIADAVMQSLQPKGVLVMIEAEHMCMTMRGVQKPGAQTMTYALKGEFEKDKNLAQMFMQMIAG